MTEQSIGEIAGKIVNRWAWWQSALANPSEIGKTILIHDGDAQQGYYRTKRDGRWLPVAIFYPEGSDALVAYVDGKEADPATIWTWCAEHPVTWDAYQDALAGKGWPDDDQTVHEQVSANDAGVDPAELLADQIAAALAGVKDYAEVKDDETATKALSLRNRLNELSRQADKTREDLKRPHLEAGKAVDAKWQPLVKNAKGGADTVKKAIEAHESRKLAALRAEEARQRELATNATADAPQAETAPTAVPATRIAPTYGKAANVQTRIVVDQVTDWHALGVYMLDHPEVRAMLLQLAQRALDAGRTVPGITTKEEAKIR